MILIAFGELLEVKLHSSCWFLWYCLGNE